MSPRELATPCHSLEPDFVPILIDPSAINPRLQILALTDIEDPQVPTAIDN
jgi:hypothetical protein